MDSQWQTEKLEALRAKTDRQLLHLILHELDQALAVMNSGPRNGDLFRAERAYSEAVLLLPALRKLRQSQQRLVEARTEELRLKLGRARAAVAARRAGG